MPEIDTIVEDQSMENNEQQSLKYLEFLHSASLQAIICFSNLYGYAKDKSGPLKPDVESVEGTIKTFVGPVYDRFQDVPFELIKFVDHKVDESLTKLDDRVPPVVKQLSTRAYIAAQKVPQVARSVASEVQHGSMMDTTSGIARNVYTKYEPKAKQIYSKYEPVAEQYAVSTWRSLNRLPLFPQVAQVLVPTAAFCSDKYNETVKSGSERGYRVANYLPFVPTDKIAKVFETGDYDEASPVVAGGTDAAVAVAAH